MAVTPQVTATTDKASYSPGEPVVITFQVEPDTRQEKTLRTVSFTGHDDEGNSVSGSITTTLVTTVADSFTLDSVKWADTGDAFVIEGLSARGVA